MNDIILEGKGISKVFPGVKALDNVDFKIKKGEIIAIVGENGAGKSTLVKIIAGDYQQDSGDLFIDNNKVKISNPAAAEDLGISVVYQEIPDCLHLTVTENVLLNNFPTKKLFGLEIIDKKLADKKVSSLLEQLGLNINVNKCLMDLNTAQRQMIAIIKAFLRGAKILIMDEPTSALSLAEINEVYKLVGKIKKSGISIIFISHKLNEVFEICEKVLILKDGKRVDFKKISEANIREIEGLMTGSDFSSENDNSINISTKETKILNDSIPQKIKSNNYLLEVKNLSRHGVFQDISFNIEQEEVVGIIGPLGAGKTEIIKCIFGLDQADSGEIRVNGELLPKRFNPWKAIEKGMGLIPEDRNKEGLFLNLSVANNIFIIASRIYANKLGVVDFKKQGEMVSDFKSSLNMKFSSEGVRVKTLSGGNKQKTIIGRCLGVKPKMLLLDEPTRGIDVKAKQEILSLLVRLSRINHMGVLFVSYEPNDFKICDRIIGIAKGKIMFQVKKGDVSINELHHFLVTSSIN